MYRCIIWMNDLSERSDACASAVTLLAGLGEGPGRVVLAHAAGRELREDEDPSPQERELLQRARVHLEDCAAPLRDEGLEVELRVVQVRPAEAPGLLAEELGGDLVVVGPTGVSGLDRLILGSTSGRILRDAPTPVLVCKRPLEALDRILCPVASDSYVSDSGIAHATRLARVSGASVHFLGVVRPTYLDREGAERRLREHVESELGGPLPAGWSVGLELHDRPTEGILGAVEGHDLLVMSSAERRGLERLLAGSVSEQVVSACPVPVLVAR